MNSVVEVEEQKDELSDAFSYDGYERLHDELMDQISVSMYSNFDEAFGSKSRSSLAVSATVEEEEREDEEQVDESKKKLKIGLSQEQLKLICHKNFLTVPVSARRKHRSLSYSCADTNHSAIEVNCLPAPPNEFVPMTKAHTSRTDDVNEIIYAVPQKQFSRPTTANSSLDATKTSSASLATPSKSVIFSNASIAGALSSSSTEMNFKYPLAFYCKLCNKILNDPRVLTCLHSFCCQCLAQLDAMNNLQNNQIWRKISDASSCRLNKFVFAC